MGDNNSRSQDDSADFEEVVTSLPSFNKKEIFKHLNQFGCSEESLEKVMSRFKISKSTAVDFLNELLRRSEKYLYQECSSFCFDNIEAWLLVLKQNDCLTPLESFAEYLAEIGNVEDFPKPIDINGINLRAAYSFIENGMLGLPQPEMNTETIEFLVKEMEALIEDVNNDEGDKAAYTMYEELEKSEIPNVNCHAKKLDPFGLMD